MTATGARERHKASVASRPEMQGQVAQSELYEESWVATGRGAAAGVVTAAAVATL